MDLITRYDKAGTYSFKKLKPILTKILKTVIADGKGIEVNTSSDCLISLRQGIF